jgi:predicted nucleic acid-binding protein
MGVEFSSIDQAAALAASVVWKEYRRRGGHHNRLVADFLIGAHALSQADRLLTRDRGFYRTYFPRLKILDPSRL